MRSTDERDGLTVGRIEQLTTKPGPDRDGISVRMIPRAGGPTHVPATITVSGPAKCRACRQYEATTRIEFMELDVGLCHSCLVNVRAVAKKEFKRSELERPRAPHAD